MFVVTIDCMTDIIFFVEIIGPDSGSHFLNLLHISKKCCRFSSKLCTKFILFCDLMAYIYTLIFFISVTELYHPILKARCVT